MVDPLHPAVGRNGNHLKLVDLEELSRLRHRGAGHAGEFAVELEEVLQGDGREGLRFLLDPHAFLRFNRLVQAIRPVAARHQAAGELVDDHDLPLLHDVVHIAFVEVMRLQAVVDEVRPLHVSSGVETLHTSQFFRSADTLFGE